MGKKKERLRELKFTKTAIKALEPPAKGRFYVYDSKQANLALCVTAAGSKVFYRCGRVFGRPVRVRIGKFPDLSVENARTLAQQMAGDIARGNDPHQERQARKHEQTLEGLFEWWLGDAKARGKRTWKADRWQFEKYLAGWKTRRLSSIRKSDVSALHARIGRSAPYQANRVLSLLRTMYNAADNVGYEGRNPTKGVKPFKETARERFLLPEELPRFFAALEKEPQIFQDFFLLLLLSGARKSNVQSMQWADIRLDEAIWRIPETKSGDAVIVHLPAKAVKILERRQLENGDSLWVFPSPRMSHCGRNTFIQDPKTAWCRIRTRARLPDLRMHDLRRTLGSWMAIGGQSLTVVGKALGHRTLRATQVYARLTYEPVVEAVDKATTAMLEAANGQRETGGSDE